MNADTKSIFEVILTGLNLVLTGFVFFISISINRKNLKIEKRLADSNSIFSIEDQTRLESKRLARDKTIELMVKVDKLFDKIRGQNNENHIDVERYVFFEMREKYWEVSIYLPKEIMNTVDQLLGKAIEAVEFWGYENNKKYYEILGNMSEMYVSLINVVRKMFYFDTTDLSEVINKRLIEIVGSK